MMSIYLWEFGEKKIGDTNLISYFLKIIDL